MTQRGMTLPDNVVKLLLSGQKTMVRFPVMPAPGFRDTVEASEAGWVIRNSSGDTPVRCPFGAAGDEIWVREAFRVLSGDVGSRLIYRASARMRGGEWQPTGKMTEEQSRIRLKITDIRAQRLADVTEKEAEREAPYAWMQAHLAETGEAYEKFQIRWIKRSDLIADSGKGVPTYRGLFSLMWDATANASTTAWVHVPWVWAVGFQCIVKTEQRPQTHAQTRSSAARASMGRAAVAGGRR